MSIQIRQYQESDRPFLRTLYLASRRAAFSWLDEERFHLEDFDSAILDETILVAIDGDNHLGFASLFIAENFLHNLFVAPHIQQRGVGKALLLAAQNLFTGQGSLKCLTKNQQARVFYQKHGWVEIATGKSHDGDYILMHWHNEKVK
ncbi:GNAT family N-acetyltransferase [Yersinia kristensenii]|uniref:GNAT family N-acetyltransferase n=1 Tax=Yersinia kristensenii TaxID=28152 RepID=UPI0005E6EB68|nr:GNAT family N-acetyltransferase [Yersinia kristensenii]MDA5471761.1 GNAT family N-acetyltransferase [Yersinia kristensenii]MDA5477417.1 GNAT family N-acetyltransferase [Yersinia kristensenii]MDA5506658.1 GNAT family N-acetyltransferase [Yersinia kristensenii]MDA5520908.1 GNAT family N-acetyltransferase [Yersinia kristensenii]MDR4898013.1 GNAT family N-acetyltransferase [Yersinia kristensenii]